MERKRLTAGPQGPHGRERTTSRLKAGSYFAAGRSPQAAGRRPHRVEHISTFSVFPLIAQMERERPSEISQQIALSRLRLPFETKQIRWRFEL